MLMVDRNDSNGGAPNAGRVYCWVAAFFSPSRCQFSHVARTYSLLVRIILSRCYGTAVRTVYLPYHRIALVAPVLF